ncbi:MoaD/ThiS family protein [Lunatibacter salilacus]|uniref:MoaD/ThiS family protein n=1 Tax=Lunatibacter salilacus TaxID=2483804 RepID=UPI00131BCD2C|nr:MoaD/ThiS family protein [Lunatibacter salilacus]
MEIKLFGITKDIVGRDMLPVPANIQVHTVTELKEWLYQQYPGLEKLSALAVAVNQTYAEDGTALDSTKEVALIPPVSGG